MSQVTHSRLLALTLVAILAGCSKTPGDSAEKAAASAPPAAADAQPAQPHPMPMATPGAEVDLSGIARAEGGKTVAEVYGEKDALAGQTVAVRGKVVKANAMVMGKNWLHVRDGSGEEGSNDLTVTTAADLPEVGATVLVSGMLAVDKDFGMGYQYPVIVEDATVTVE